MKQREIKFQILHKNIIVGEERLNEGSWEWTWFELNPDNFIRWTKGVITTGEGLIRRQFTGLLDTDGNEVYESDIIKNCDTGLLQIVYWNEHDAAWYCRYIQQENRVVSLADSIGNLNTVTGNIYQNPELL